MHVNYQKMRICALILGIAPVLHADPLIYLKNNSDRRISIEPLAANTTFKPESIAPNGEYKVNSTGETITGIRISYCPNTAAASCSSDETAFSTATKKGTTFYFDAPKAEKYYVKLTIDKNDKVLLEAQAGRFGRTSDLKYSLSDNIKTNEIKSTPARPQQAAPERKMAPKMSVSTPSMPLMEQAAIVNKDLPLIGERFQEIGADLENIKKLSAEKNITRGKLSSIENLFDKAIKKYKELKDEINGAQYQLTQNEETLAQEINESITNIKNIISKLRDFLKMPSSESSLQKPVAQKNAGAISNELTVEEKQRVLKAIQKLAPSLYDLMIQEDPTGKDHIFRHHGLGAMVAPSKVTGLPLIYVDYHMMNWPQGELLFTLGHELGHYVLGHSLEDYHQNYSPEEILKTARNRIRESECDRMSIIEFGNSIDDGIATVQHWMEAQDEQSLQAPHKKTLTTTHPLGADRIKALESLRREVELNKARNAQRTPIDWKKLAQEYKQVVQPQPIDASLVQQYVNKKYTRENLDKYVNNVVFNYKNAGELKYFAQSDVDDQGKPWSIDTIADFLSDNLYEVERDIKNRNFTKEAENKFISDLLHTYYNAKLLELSFQGDEKIRALTESTIEALLNKKIEGNSVINIIKKFENSNAS